MQRKRLSSSLFATLVLLFGSLSMISFIESNASDLNLDVPQFLNVAPGLGINLYSKGYGPNFVDFDSDGLVDFFFTNHLDPHALFKGLADGTFTNIGPSGITERGDMHGAAWGDCDGNAFLDLYISMGDEQPSRLYRNNGDNTFTDIAAQVGVADTGRGRGSSWVDYDNDGILDIFTTNADQAGKEDRLYQGLGNCAFTDVSSVSGDIAKGFHKYGVAWADIENDGDMDVFGATNAQLFRNNGDGTFTDITQAAGLYNENTNGMAWGDYNNDGYVDLFTARTNLNQSIDNRLYRNIGNGTFIEVAAVAGVNRSLGGEDAAWADFNNDGYLDLYVVNSGHPNTGDQPNFLFLNQQDGTFQEVAGSVGAAGTADGQTGSVAIGDYNRDGFTDILLTKGLSTFSVGGYHELLSNGGNEGHWLKIKLLGQESNSLGIGARVVIHTPSGLSQTRQANGGAHHYAQDELLLSFGLGSETLIDQMTVYWPSGIVQQISSIAADQLITISESGTVILPSPTPAEDTPTPTATLTTLTPTNTATSTSTVPDEDTPTPTDTSTPTPTNTATSTPTHTPTPTNTPTPTATGVSPTDLIFSDGFESGSLSAWTSNQPDGGDLSVSLAAAMTGSYGLQAVIDDNKAIYVTDDQPNAEKGYRVIFSFDPNSIVMANQNAHYIFYGYKGTTTAVVRLELRFYNRAYQVRAATMDDRKAWKSSSWFTILDSPHAIELDWRAASKAGANDGKLTLWIDAVHQATLQGIDNDTIWIDRVRLGAVQGMDNGTRGTYYFDSFESTRATALVP